MTILLETPFISTPSQFREYISSHLQSQCSSFCPPILSPFLYKNTFLNQKKSQKSLTTGSETHNTSFPYTISLGKDPSSKFKYTFYLNAYYFSYHYKDKKSKIRVNWRLPIYNTKCHPWHTGQEKELRLLYQNMPHSPMKHYLKVDMEITSKLILITLG